MFLVPNWCSHCKQQETKLDFSVKCMVLVKAPIKLIWKWRRAALSHTVCKFGKKSSNGSNNHYRVYFWLQKGIFTVFMIMGNIPDPRDWLLIGIGLSSEDHIFSFFFCYVRVFLSFCLEKVKWFYSLFSSKFYDQFWCLFSRSDCHTPTNYLRSHLGLRSTKILLWAVTLQI